MTRRVLIAEDDAIVAKCYQREFDSHAVVTTIVGNGEEAINALKNTRFDLVLLDLLMPVKDGFAVLEYCKSHNIRIPVVVILTNLPEDLTKEKCRKMGAEDFIAKSAFTVEQVWEKVKIWLPVSEAEK